MGQDSQQLGVRVLSFLSVLEIDGQKGASSTAPAQAWKAWMEGKKEESLAQLSANLSLSGLLMYRL